MSRLPTPGQDDGVWGNVLNDFLAVEHNADGTLKPSGSLAAKANDADVVHISGTETINGAKSFQVSPIVPAPTLGGHATTKTYVDATVSAGASDASTSSKGIVQLTGDFSGTATAPQVVGTHLSSALPVAQGGTGATTLSGLVVGNGTAGMTAVAAPAGTVVGTTDTQTLTNKSISGSQITSAVANATNAATATTATTAAAANALNSATTTVVVNGATAPTANQVLTASSGTAAAWQTPTAVQSVNGKTGTSVTLTSSDISGVSAPLAPTAVKTSSYSAAVGDLVPVDVSAGSVAITLPTAPADKSMIGVKLINLGGTSNTVTVNAGSGDVFNKSGGSASITLSTSNQAFTLQYNASGSIWYVFDSISQGAMDSRYVATTGGGKEVTGSQTASTASTTVSLANGNVQMLTLGASTTITLNGATNGVACSLSLYLQQDATGNRTLTWPASVKWPGGAAPVLSTAASKIDLVVLETLNGGTTWYGSLSGADFR